MVTIFDIDGNVLREFPELDTLAGADLSCMDLMFADFSGMDLTDTNFWGADLYGACFDDAILDGTNFANTYYEIQPRRGGLTHKIRGY